MRGTLSPRLCGFLLAAGLLLVSSTANAQGGANPPDVDPTHYWSYHVEQDVFHPNPIRVSDQFFRLPVAVTAESLERLVNWVHKNGSAVTDTFIHYTWWSIHEKLPMSVPVIVTNQFGSQRVQVDQLDFMLVPAWKYQPQPVLPHANHYLCYRAHGFNPPPNSFDFLDEWRQDIANVYPMEFLCVPCTKEHFGQIFPPVDTLTHLAVYPLFTFSLNFSPLVTDQFLQGSLLVSQRPTEYLFVPSEKTLIPTDVKHGSWGRLKTLYR
jgi:hypothetical protein